MKKYLRLTCNVCKRTTDRLVDNTRFAPDRCTITLRCQGRLLPVEYRSDGQITTAPQIGVTDWVPRGSTQQVATVVAEPRLLDTSTGVRQQLVLAVALPSEPPPGSTATLSLQVRAETSKDFKSYVYRRDTEFSTISGVEDGLSQKTLKFRVWGPDPDEVQVYLNGVKLIEGPGAGQYQLDDGSPTPPAPSNTIKFNEPILPDGTYQVEVIVSKAQPAVVQQLVFLRNTDNDARLDLGAWENVSYIERFDGSLRRFYLFTFDVLQNGVLTRDTILFPVGTVFVDTGAGSFPIAPSDCFIALSRKPHTKVDRYPDISVYLDALNANTSYLKYHTVNGVLSLEVAETALSQFFPPSVVGKFNPESTIKVQVEGEEEQLVVDGKLIVGPDT